VAKAQFRGNTWSAFSVITPRWRAFVDKILRSPSHVICCGRSKTETAQVDDHGKKKVAKLGMKLEARDGLEFEFTVVLDLIHDGHYATVSKDRTGLFAGDPKPITPETGRALSEWLGGATPLANPLVAQIREFVATAEPERLKATTKRIDALLAEGKLTSAEWESLTDAITARVDGQAAVVAAAE
jgi:hypothetical protein